MNLASDRHKPSMIMAAQAAMFSQPQNDQDFDLAEITDLAERFRDAHARLNNIELELHQNLGSGDRLTLLRTLEEARMEYSDARFALSTRSFISSRR